MPSYANYMNEVAIGKYPDDLVRPGCLDPPRLRSDTVHNFVNPSMPPIVNKKTLYKHILVSKLISHSNLSYRLYE